MPKNMPNKPTQNPSQSSGGSAGGEDMQIDTLAETENYVAWVSHEPDGETVYHLEVGAVTLHLYQEEFEEMADLVADAAKAAAG